LTLCFLLALSLQGWCHNEQEETSLSVSVRGTTLKLAYLTKFPSMSSFVQLKELDSNGDKQYSDAEKQVFLERRLASYWKQAQVSFNGLPIKLSAPDRQVTVSEGGVGLQELSVSYTLVGELPGQVKVGDSLRIQDLAFGWNRYEITTDSGGASEVVEPSVGDTMVVTFVAGAATASAAPGRETGHAPEEDKLLALVSSEMTPGVLATTLGLAFVLGALHALTPGHGKTMVAAYLVGSRGTVSQAVLLGVVVTITHTASVFLLGIACMVAFQYVVPDKVIPWLGFVSGLLVTGVGATLLVGRLSGRDWGHGHSHEHGHSHGHQHAHRKHDAQLESAPGHSHNHAHEAPAHSHGHDHSHEAPAHSHGHDHSHEAPAHSHGHDHSHDAPGHSHGHDHSHEAPGHSHGHDHAHEAPGHSHDHDEPVSAPVVRQVPDAPAAESVSLWALVSLGISGGLVPCPEALVVLLAAISLNKLLLGMLVLVAFSLGLASLLVLIGILVVSATRMSKRYYPSDETIRRISIASYVVICGLGLAIAVRSLVSGGIISINL
jgi:ABC-type nickel/cobalt efflux system permease component RcnA